MVIAALRELGGYFVFPAGDGREYVITAKEDFEDLQQSVRDVQLALPGAGEVEEVPSAGDMLDKINRDIALFQWQQDQDRQGQDPEEEEMEFDSEEIEQGDMVEEEEPTLVGEELQKRAYEPPRRIRFEPIRGDLPPELQE